MAKDAPQNNAYTGLLAISLLAMLIACALLYMDYSQYEGKNPPATPKLDIPQVKSAPSSITPKGAGDGAPAPSDKGAPAPNDKGTPMMRINPEPKAETVSIPSPEIVPPPPAPEMIPLVIPKTGPMTPKTTAVEIPAPLPTITPPAPIEDPKLKQTKAEEPAFVMPDKKELIAPPVSIKKPEPAKSESIDLLIEPPPLKTKTTLPE